MSKQRAVQKIKGRDRDEVTCVGFGRPREQFLPGNVRALASRKDVDGNPYGLGAALNPTIEDLRSRANCPLLTMPTVIEVSWLLGGPQSDEVIDVSFGAEIDPFHSGRSPNIDGVVSTNLAMPGETQTHMIICGIGWHFEPEPFCGTVLGNAFTHPITGVTQLLSPDVFTSNDLLDGFGVTPGVPVPGIYLPAVLEWGTWANIVAWKMAQAYDLRWMVGTNCNILLDSLRNTAYMPPAAQTGSASDSQLDANFMVRETNNYYDQFLGSALNFMKVNAIRIGSAGAAPNVGAFRPSRDRELIDVTYGGIGLSGLLQGNTEFRPLSMPYIVKAGVPVGLKAEVRDDDLATEMRAWLSASQGFGGVPPSFTDQVNINSNSTGVAGNERTLDGLNVPQTQNSARTIFKGGRLNIKVKLKGFEITEDLYTLMANNPDIRDAICSDCGIRFAQQGA